ncbi:MAG: tryptophan--tRNA ligase [Pseudomonadales bacterium]|jgi:tryptophanyl-tRNA synthetase
MKPTLLSGIAPSGRLTLGNYLGAIRSWVKNQNRYQCFFPLVDLHAITVRQDTETFAERCRDFVALYLACGVNPDTSVVFIQSHVAEHSELAWLLQCHTQVGELSRMTQFKDKSRRNKGDINAGLFGYPVLMAADIVLYKSTLVPVGEDQRQHLELTRDIVARFNGLYGPTFPIPEAYVPDSGARIMSLQDPTKKMSKSDAVESNIIALLDDPADIARKVKRCVTDSGSKIVVREDKPGVSNLLNILAAITGKSRASLENEYVGQGYGRLKSAVADAVIALVEPIQDRFKELRSNDQELDAMLTAGAIEARETARNTLREVHSLLGFIPKPSLVE